MPVKTSADIAGQNPLWLSLKKLIMFGGGHKEHSYYSLIIGRGNREQDFDPRQSADTALILGRSTNS